MIAEPFWWDSAAPVRGDGVLPARADVAVIGGGLTGLSAALTLSRGGLDVVVIDGAALGAGASTRNAGFLSAELRRPLAALIERFGRARALAIAREARRAAAFLKALIDEENLDCTLHMSGRLVLACRPRHYHRLAEEARLESRLLGASVEMIPRAELESEIGSDLYHGAKLQAQCGVLHPGQLLRGLATRVREAGATLVSDNPVMSVRGARSRFLVTTRAGEVSAGRLVVATNGYSGRAVPYLRRRLVSLDVHMIATARLAPDRMRALLPQGRACIESSRIRRFFRASPAHDRLLFGGRVSQRASVERAHRELASAMHAVFPQIRDVALTHVWSGRIALTGDGLPHAGERDGLHYVAGMNGAGIAMGPYLGHQVARGILKGRKPASPLLGTAGTRIPALAPLTRPLAPLVERYHAMRDWMERLR